MTRRSPSSPTRYAKKALASLPRSTSARQLKEKLGAELPPYVILGVCNPSLANRALGEDIDIGLLLPFNVVVRQENHSTLVSVLDPTVISDLSGAPGLKAIADEAHGKLEWALERAFDEYIE